MKKLNSILNYPDLYPVDIVESARRFTTTGCKSRAEYEHLVLFSSTSIKEREELLNS